MIEDLEAERRRAHRLDPSAPIFDTDEAVAFIVERGVVMASGKSSLPTLTEAIVGRTIKGSWMADAEVHRIHDLWVALDKSAAITSAPLVQGKQVYVSADLAAAVQTIAGDPVRLARAVDALKPLERRLFDAVIESGEVRMDEWAQINAVTTSQARTARSRLQALFLAVGDELHTDAGYHTVVLTPMKHKRPKMKIADATRQLLRAAIRACVLAEAKEVRKWNDWSSDALDRLLDDGDVAMLDRYVVHA